MATAKVLSSANSSFSLSGGFKNIFSCCFANSNPKETKVGERKEQKSENTLGTSGEIGETEERRGETELRADTSHQVWSGRKTTQARREDSDEDDGENSASPSLCDLASATGDDFRDSAIDSASLNSQLNLKGSIDGEKMKTVEGILTHESGDDITRQDGRRSQLDSNSSEDLNVPPDIIHDFRSRATEETGRIEEENGREFDQPNDEGTEEKQTDRDNVDTGQTVIQCGKIRLTFVHETGRNRLSLTVHEANDIPDHDRVNLSHSEVHILLHLSSKKMIRQKTKAKAGEKPQFEETFRFKVSSDEMTEAELRVRLYRSERFKKERMIGESCLALSSVLLPDKDAPRSIWVTLEPRFNLNSVAPSSDDQVDADHHASLGRQSQPTMTNALTSELMLGLAYNAATGRLSVEVIQGCNFKSPGSVKPPDTFVKLRLLSPNGQEIARSRTTPRKSQPNPYYKETFMFHVPQSQLPDVSLMVSVCKHHHLKHSQMLGWFTLGHTYSSEESKRHWTAMVESNGESISQWHSLLNP